MNYHIETNRLILREWEPTDIERLILFAGQEHIEHWMPDWKEYDKHAKGWIDMVIRHYKQNNPMESFIAWAVTLKESRKLIGFVGLGAFDELGEKEIGIAYWLDIEHNGHGYATEAVKAVVNSAFEQYDYDHIVATVQPDNHPSRRVMEKAGFKSIRTIEFKDSGQTEILPFCYYRLDNPCFIVNVREHPSYADRAIDYFFSKWGIDRKVYEESIADSITTNKSLPRWYLMLQGDRIIGSYGLIENDFMVRKDLMPWLCALYIEESEHCKGLGGKLLTHGRQEAAKLGFENVYLCTDHVGYYEKHGWRFFGMEESEFGGETRVYEAASISQAKYEVVPVQNKEKLFAYYNSFKEKVPYYHEASFALWESSMFSDSDSEGDLFFTKLYTYVALNEDAIAGYIQFGIPNFLYNDGGKEYSPHAGVIRTLLYDADKPEAGQSLIETALSFFDENDITKRHAFYHALGMTCTAWQGKLFETLFHVESLLTQYGFIKEHENVYFKRLITESDRQPQNGMSIQYGDMSSAGTQDINFYQVVCTAVLFKGRFHHNFSSHKVFATNTAF